MRPSTRISEAGSTPRRRARAAACFLLSLLLLCLSARPGAAVPVVVEARERAAAGDVFGAARGAARAALVEAVRVVVRRHVNPADLAEHATLVQRSVLNRAPRFVLRYSIADERWDGLSVVVRVEAEVDTGRVLARLTEVGIPVAQLTVRPRLLLVALEPAAEPALEALSRTLENAGFPSRRGARPGEPAGGPGPGAGRTGVAEEQVGAWARAAGCHLALVVAPAAGTGAAGADTEAAARADGSAGLWLDPGGEPVRAALALEAWLVDPSGRVPLGRLEARGEGQGEGRPAAEGAAGESAGRRLGYAALELLEQSAWAPEGVPSILDVTVSGLLDPLLVEEIGAALAAVPEVRRVGLTEVARRRAAWRLQVVDAGLDWAAVLSAARLPRGRLEWAAAPAAGRRDALAATDPTGAPAAITLAGRWLGP